MRHLLLLLLFAPTLAFAQEDTVYNSNFEKNYNYLIRAQEEETKIWKIFPVHSPGFGKSSGSWEINNSLSAGFEGKLSPSFSLYGEISLLARYLNNYQENEAHLLGKQANFRLSTRYYYNLKRRIRLGKSVNNFSANYFSLGLNRLEGLKKHEGKTGQATYLFLKYGIQRRLGSTFLIDFNFGIRYSLQNPQHEVETKFEPSGNFGIGIGF